MLNMLLKRLNVPTLIVDALARPGDSWRSRYRSLYLHDPIYLDDLPYLPFPDHWPIYTPKDKMGDWLESYVKIMELDYWSSSPCKIRVGTSTFLRSSVRSVSENALIQK